jgi:hypothetical protein
MVSVSGPCRCKNSGEVWAGRERPYECVRGSTGLRDRKPHRVPSLKGVNRTWVSSRMMFCVVASCVLVSMPPQGSMYGINSRDNRPHRERCTSRDGTSTGVGEQMRNDVRGDGWHDGHGDRMQSPTTAHDRWGFCLLRGAGVSMTLTRWSVSYPMPPRAVKPLCRGTVLAGTHACTPDQARRGYVCLKRGCHSIHEAEE